MPIHIKLGQYNQKPDINIGYILEKEFKEHGIDFNELKLEEKVPNMNITIQICNGVIWGNFCIPVAIGFSTPIGSLGILTDNDTLNIQFNSDEKDGNSLKMYLEWKKVYQPSVYHKYDVKQLTYSSDMAECGICLDSYQVGEKLIELLCQHKFHLGCYEKMNVRAPCPYCRKQGILPDLTGLSSKDKILQVMREHGF